MRNLRAWVRPWLLLAVVMILVVPAGARVAGVDGRLGPIRLDGTTIRQAEALLGKGRPIEGDGPYRRKGWYDGSSNTSLVLGDMSAAHRKGLDYAPTGGVLLMVLATSSRLQADTQLQPSTLAPSRIALSGLVGPNGIRLGDTRARVVALCGAGQEAGRRGSLVRCNYYNVRGYRKLKPNEPGFIMQLTFEKDRVTSIHVFEAS